MGRFHYLEILEARFFWPKAAGYYWSDTANVKEVINKKSYNEPPYLFPWVDEDNERRHTIEQPLLKMNTKLFLDFAELSPDQDSVLHFANTYGMLTGGEIRAELPNKEQVYVETFSFWKEEIENMAFAVKLFESIQNKRNYIIEDLIKVDGKAGIVLYGLEKGKKTSLLINRKRDPELFTTFRAADSLNRTRILLEQYVNMKLGTYRTSFPVEMSANPQVYLNSEGGFETYLQPQTMLSAMWIQFTQALIGERRYKRCQSPLCLKWEDVSDHKRNWNYHPGCASRDRMTKFREKSKEAG